MPSTKTPVCWAGNPSVPTRSPKATCAGLYRKLFWVNPPSISGQISQQNDLQDCAGSEEQTNSVCLPEHAKMTVDERERSEMVQNGNRTRIRIDVSNYGPIAEAAIDLRPLTVFVGPSNTGKSYLAILTYALHRFFSGASSNTEIGVSTPPRTSSLPLPFGNVNVNNRDVGHETEVLLDWIQQLSTGPESAGSSLDLPDNVASIVRKQLLPHSTWNEILPGELARCFGTADAGWLIRHGTTSEATISVKYLRDDAEYKDALLRFDFNLSGRGLRSSSSVSESIPLRINRDFASHVQRRMRFYRSWFLERNTSQSFVFQTLASDLAGAVGSTMVIPLSKSAHYLPADRTGVMHAHQVVVASMISSSPFAGLRNNISLPSLSGVLSDFLLQLLSLGNDESLNREARGTDLSTNIEERMLLGTIQTDRSNRLYPIFSYMPHGWKKELPLMNSSSMVSELAPIVLYLRHVVKQGDVLIIEEPESNLHPSMQVELVKQLATVVNSGVRVMLTTHSEWILEELANLMRLSDLASERRTEALKTEPALDRRDVGVWLFEKNEGAAGSRVKEIPLDPNEGGFATGYDQIARLTYNQWAAIQNLIEG